MSVTRRQFTIGTLGTTLVASFARAAPPGDRVVRIGTMITGTQERWSRFDAAISQALRGLGYVEGRNLTLHRRFAEFPDKRMAEYAAEFAKGSVDVVFTSCGWSSSLAAKATTTIPIVMGSIADPVGMGLVNSLQRPGRNVTGQINRITALTPKMFEVLLATLPDTRVVAALGDPANPRQKDRAKQLEEAARAAGVKTEFVDIHAFATEFGGRDRLRETGATAMVVLPDNDVIWKYIDRVSGIATELKVATLFSYRDMLDFGGLMSYGPDQTTLIRQAALQIDRIVNGANPAEMPIEGPTKLEFVINVRKAAQLGISIPRSILLRADTVV